MPMTFRAQDTAFRIHSPSLECSLHLTRCRSTCGRRLRHTVAKGLFDSIRGVLLEKKGHSPELVRIDMESEGGLGGTSEGVFGPLACALVGYYPVEVDRFRAFMNDMEADMVKVVCCGREQLQGTLQQALEGPTPAVADPKLGLKKAVFLSGMTGEEVSEVIGAYNDSGLPETVWAAAVPMNYDRKLEELVEDIYGDHVYLRNNPDVAPK